MSRKILRWCAVKHPIYQTMSHVFVEIKLFLSYRYELKVMHRANPGLLEFIALSHLYCNSIISYTWSWRLSVTIHRVVDNV